MFFVVFLALPRIQTMASMTHIPTSNDLVVTNEGQWKIEQLFFFFSCHPMWQLCTNILLAEGSKHFLVLGMLSNFGVLYMSFFSHQTLYSC
jgi:hypothetical protein